ncbi:hypothetical protein ACWHLZ_41960 [Streptomyces chartreusis]
MSENTARRHIAGTNPANLKAMCQSCHLHYDQDHHAHPRAVARRTALEAFGQLTFEM